MYRVVVAIILLLLPLLGAKHAAAADFAPLQIGMEYTMRRTAADGTVATDVWKVTKEEAYQGKAFFVVERNDGFAVWLRKENRALVYALRDGKTVDTYSPDWGDWQWPLAVGKSWSTTYGLLTGGRNIAGASGTWTVAAEESVTVPAGTFKAFRIERAPGNNSNHKVVRWYAPEVGLVVRQIDSRTGQPGEQIQELVAFKR